jgi:MoaA/NifB/PqqE/SkfB family radical SAM enzyme
MKTLYIVTTNKCTLSCRYCFYNTGLSQKSLSDIKTEKILGKIKSLSKYFDNVVFTGGEPLLIRDVFLIASGFKKNKVKTNLITNGTLLTHDICDKIYSVFDKVSISLDSLDSRLNGLTRGKSSIVINGLNNLLSVRSKSLEVEIIQTITTVNYESINEMIKFCDEKNIKLWLPPVDLNYDNPFSLKRLNDVQMDKFKNNFRRWIQFAAGSDKKEKVALSNFLNNIESLLQNKPIQGHCKMGIENFVLDPNGNIYACFFRTDLFFGNIYKDKLSQIMKKNPERETLRNCISLGCLSCTDF